MSSPWLAIPLAAYERHMKSEEVQQLHVLADLLGEVLGRAKPKSVAILGVAGGNGLERIDPRITTRVCGIDINAGYLQIVADRFQNLPGLELHCLDLKSRSIDVMPAELVHAALIFEHTGLNPALDHALKLVNPGGALSVVLQLQAPSPEQNIRVDAGSPMARLREHFHLIDPEEFKRRLAGSAFQLLYETHQALPGGKAFWMGMFQKAIT
jgi:hypothetical protein